MDKAILYEMQQQDRKALLSWIKVAIYWLSCPNPYALALRPRLVLCQEKVIETLTPLSRDKVNAFLLEKINHLAVLAEMKEQESELSHFDFIPAETKNDTKKSSYVAEGMVIYGYKAQTKERKHSCTPVELALQRVVSRLVKTIMNIGKDEQILAIEMNHDCFNAKIKETQASNEHV